MYQVKRVILVRINEEEIQVACNIKLLDVDPVEGVEMPDWAKERAAEAAQTWVDFGEALPPKEEELLILGVGPVYSLLPTQSVFFMAVGSKDQEDLALVLRSIVPKKTTRRLLS